MKGLLCLSMAGALLMASDLVHSATVRCEVRGIDAIQIAQEQGYSSNATRLDGAGNCIIENNTAVAVATGDGGGLTCRFGFFTAPEERAFPSGWTRKAFNIQGAPHERVSGLTEGKPYVAVVLKVKAGQTATINLRTLTLEGPDCSQWHEAFSAQ